MIRWIFVLFLTSSVTASPCHLVYPAGFGQDAALTAHRAVIHSRVPRFATLKGKALLTFFISCTVGRDPLIPPCSG
ncbi:MAG: hypothetical protein IKI03_10680 [Clostridia bacterium]|nr:hypothetical protein [Clostridia bacterium]